MKNELIFEGTGKYLRLSNKPKDGGTRYKLFIDDLRLSQKVDEQIKEAIINHKANSDKFPLLNIQDFIRNKKIEVRVIE